MDGLKILLLIISLIALIISILFVVQMYRLPKKLKNNFSLRDLIELSMNQTNKQTNENSNKQTNENANKQTNENANKQTNENANKQTNENANCVEEKLWSEIKKYPGKASYLIIFGKDKWMVVTNRLNSFDFQVEDGKYVLYMNGKKSNNNFADFLVRELDEYSLFKPQLINSRDVDLSEGVKWLNLAIDTPDEYLEKVNENGYKYIPREMPNSMKRIKENSQVIMKDLEEYKRIIEEKIGRFDMNDHLLYDDFVDHAFITNPYIPDEH